MTHVDTYEGVEISLNSSGKFQATVNGKLETAASLSTIKQKIKATHVGDVRGRVEGLQEPVTGSVEYGFRLPDPLVILGVSSEKEGRGSSARVEPVFVVEKTPTPYNRASTGTRAARDLVRPNPEAVKKLDRLHDELVRRKRELQEEAQRILATEFERVSVDEIKKLLEAQ